MEKLNDFLRPFATDLQLLSFSETRPTPIGSSEPRITVLDEEQTRGIGLSIIHIFFMRLLHHQNVLLNSLLLRIYDLALGQWFLAMGTLTEMSVFVARYIILG